MKLSKVHTKLWVISGGLVLLMGLTVAVRAGSLEPLGPPGPTMKTLDEVEPRIPISSGPYTISQSGSYYLTKNLTGKITIIADNVTLDLMGYMITTSSTDAIDSPQRRRAVASAS